MLRRTTGREQVHIVWGKQAAGMLFRYRSTFMVSGQTASTDHRTFPHFRPPFLAPGLAVDDFEGVEGVLDQSRALRSVRVWGSSGVPVAPDGRGTFHYRDRLLLSSLTSDGGYSVHQCLGLTKTIRGACSRRQSDVLVGLVSWEDIVDGR